MSEQPKYKYVSQLVNRIEGIPSVPSMPFSNDQSSPPDYASAVQPSQERGEEEVLPPKEILRINKDHDTDRKGIDSDGDRDSVDRTTEKYLFDDDDDDDDDDDVPPLRLMDTREIMEAIQELKDQQEKLKRLHEDHDRKLENLMHQQPAINRGLTLIRQKTLREHSGASNEVIRRPPKAAVKQEEQRQQHRNVYVQLEQLYTNIHLMHFPSKTIQDVLGHTPSPFGGSGVYSTACETLDMREIDKLIQENEELKKKVAELEANKRDETPQLRTPKDRGRNIQTYPPEPHMTGVGCSKEESGQNSQKDNVKEDEFNATGVYRSDHPNAEQLPPLNLGRRYEVNCVTGRPTSPLSSGSHTQIRTVSIYHTISDYSQKLAQEKRHVGFKQVSRPFYVTHEGYRAQMEVYFNGNGTGYGKCLSVFMRLVPGEYDNILNWPVKLSMQVTLINQGRHAESLEGKPTQQFEYSQPQGRSDKESDCWGLVEFVNHEKTADGCFVVHDTIQLRIKLRFEAGVGV